MSRVITGTGKKKKFDTVRVAHPAGPNKMRCSACGIGMCVEVINAGGEKIMKCQRCGREQRSAVF